MNSIVGLDGLDPTLKLIKFTKNIELLIKIDYLWMEFN